MVGATIVFSVSSATSNLMLNGLTNAVGQYWWTRALHLAPASAAGMGRRTRGLRMRDVPTIGLLIGSAVVGSGLFLLWREQAARV
jgi:uncharacterized membrane protein YfcA